MVGIKNVVRAGQILTTSPQHLILRAEGPLEADINALPRFGSRMLDANLDYVGTLHDIFGPTSKPFLSVKVRGTTSLDTYQSRKGEPLYVETRPKPQHRRPKRKKSSPRPK